MYFRPRIFVSSTLDLKTIRKDIKAVLEKSGAEVMLYEHDLTPSIAPSTYRQDVLEADFVIFVFHERYGARTETGLSGTNEEWLIVKEAAIPKHVYLRKDPSVRDRRLNAFVERELAKDNISYYYYKTPHELLSRIASTVFTIAKEISIYRLHSLHVDPKVIRSEKVKRDYDKGMQFIKQIDETIQLANVGLCSLIESTVLTAIMEPWEYDSQRNHGAFIDEKLNELFGEVAAKYSDFYELHSNSYTSNGRSHTLRLKWSQTELVFHELRTGRGIQFRKVDQLLHSFLKKYAEFKAVIERTRTETDVVV
jgi:Domain of unknown function (DUF4062)